MKPNILLCLALVLSGGLLGCATQPQNATYPDRSHVLEAALRYEFDRFDKSAPNVVHGVTKYIIWQSESDSWLAGEFHGHKPPVVSLDDIYRAGATPVHCMFWSAKIQTFENDHAKIYVTFYEPPESYGGYILELHREKRQWIVDSEK